MAEGLSFPVHDQLCDWLFPLLVSLVWLVIVGQAFDDTVGTGCPLSSESRFFSTAMVQNNVV